MTTQVHPKFNLTINTSKGKETMLTTYDTLSTSPTKLKYSFGLSKDKRFPSVKKTHHEQIGYDLPPTKGKRAAGFGIGKRFAEMDYKLKKKVSPSPDTYEIPQGFKGNPGTLSYGQNGKPAITYCFGAGREAFERVVISKRNLSPDRSTPGPGQYNPLKPLGQESLKFKIKHKLEFGDPVRTAIKNNFPPPGAYDHKLSLDKIGSYNHYSEWKSSKAARWSPPYDRFKAPVTTQMITPGPGTHDVIGEIYKGQQHVSTYKSIKSPSFGIGQRSAHLQKRFQTPGPGSYRAPSDFGYVTMSRKKIANGSETPTIDILQAATLGERPNADLGQKPMSMMKQNYTSIPEESKVKKITALKTGSRRHSSTMMQYGGGGNQPMSPLKSSSKERGLSNTAANFYSRNDSFKYSYAAEMMQPRKRRQKRDNQSKNSTYNELAPMKQASKGSSMTTREKAMRMMSNNTSILHNHTALENSPEVKGDEFDDLAVEVREKKFSQTQHKRIPGTVYILNGPAPVVPYRKKSVNGSILSGGPASPSKIMRTMATSSVGKEDNTLDQSLS